MAKSYPRYLFLGHELATCAHVLDLALARPTKSVDAPKDDKIILDFPFLNSNQKIIGQTVFWDSSMDVAVLEISEAIPKDITVSKLIINRDLWGQKIVTFGFPKGYPDGVWASGEIRGTGTNGWVAIVDPQQTGFFIQGGFSGGAVWSEELKGIVGMVIASDRNAETRTAYMLPIEIIISLAKGLVGSGYIQDKSGQVLTDNPRIDSADNEGESTDTPSDENDDNEKSTVTDQVRHPTTIDDNALEKHAATDKPIQKIEQDRLGFGVYVTALHDFIVSRYTTTPLTISVDGPWGAGKSSLMYMLKNSLEPQNNIWRRLVSWFKSAITWFVWFLLWFFSLPIQTFGRVLLRLVLKFNESTKKFDFRIGENNLGFRSLITDIAQGLSTNPEVLRQKDNKLTSGAKWWARVHANCEAHEPLRHPTIWLNAWKFDNQEEVWASLALATLEQLKQKHNILWMMWFRIRLTFKRLSFLPALGVILIQFVLPVVLGVIAIYYDVIVNSFDKPLQAFANIPIGYGSYLFWAGALITGSLTVSSVFKDPFQIPVDKVFDRPNYKEKVGFLTRFEKDFSRIVDLATHNGFGWKKSKLIIFVDDLDRCEPPKAADIVEAVNLFLDAEGCVFVVGMDSESVARSIEVKYKDLFERMKTENAGVVSLGRAFLDKIVQIPFTVPRATSSQILKMVEDTLGANLSKSISISQPKEKELEETKDSEEKKEDERDSASTTETASEREDQTSLEPAEGEKESAETFDPASFAREEVRQAVRLGTKLLNENPRQAKTFVNLFRLSIYIANARGYFEEKRTDDQIDLLGLDRLAYWVVCSVRWQNLVRHLYQETQIDSLCGFLYDVSQNITTKYRWTTGRKNIPVKVKKKFDDLRKAEKGIESHWCHLPWDWWLLEPDFLKTVKLLENLWAPSTSEDSELNVLLNMSRPLSPTTSTEAK